MTAFTHFSLAIFIALFMLVDQTGAFAILPQKSLATTTTTTHYMFKGLSDAFKSDDSLGKPQNAGLKGGPNYNENVTVNGKPVKGAVVGQKLTVVAGRARVKIPVNCQNGECGTCMVKMNGRKVKACVTSLGSGKCNIETL